MSASTQLCYAYWCIIIDAHLNANSTYPHAAAFTYACCNPNAPAIPSGGLWVVDPSIATTNYIWNLMANPLPGSKEGDGLYERYWMWGDMQLVRYAFGNMTWRSPAQPLWPFVEDSSHGVVPGLRYLPKYHDMPETEFNAQRRWSAGGPLQGIELPDGFREEWSDVSWGTLQHNESSI